MYVTTILKGRVEHQKIAQISVVLMNDQSWIKRTGEEHKQLSRMLQLAKTAIERKEIEKEHGCKIQRTISPTLLRSHLISLC